MQKVDYNEYLPEAFESLPDGAFLTVQSDGEKNTMTIGWNLVGVNWSLPMTLVMVRSSRHTHQLLEDTDEYTISFPLGEQMQEELKYCGSRSGRDHDKFEECDLQPLEGRQVETPVIGGCDLYYECEIVYSQHMDPDKITSQAVRDCYPEGDYHTLYFGRILDSYLAE